ncbi:MAG: hypothetical protein Phog2KO_08290 [Phototrophicaceae bacterium]
MIARQIALTSESDQFVQASLSLCESIGVASDDDLQPTKKRIRLAQTRENKRISYYQGL